MKEESKFIQLAKVWNGHDDALTRIKAARGAVKMLIPDSVNDYQMNCGGRDELDRILRSEVRGTLRQKFCGGCAVKAECTLAKAMNSKA